MLIIIHVSCALASLACSAYLILRPAKQVLKLSLVLISLTAVSGATLILCEQDHILQSCITGLLYVGISSLASISAWRRLAKQKI